MKAGGQNTTGGHMHLSQLEAIIEWWQQLQKLFMAPT
jgi:hypothetical protein